jgi:hypothetical protein
LVFVHERIPKKEVVDPARLETAAQIVPVRFANINAFFRSRHERAVAAGDETAPSVRRIMLTLSGGFAIEFNSPFHYAGSLPWHLFNRRSS